MIEYKTSIDCIHWLQLTSLYFKVGMVGGLGEQGNREHIEAALSKGLKDITPWGVVRLI